MVIILQGLQRRKQHAGKEAWLRQHSDSDFKVDAWFAFCISKQIIAHSAKSGRTRYSVVLVAFWTSFCFVF